MAWPTSLSIALKEWASVCNAIETGRQILLLRKGGIYESAGEFELENPQFLLFPTYLHQNLAMLRPEAHEGFKSEGARRAHERAEPDRFASPARCNYNVTMRTKLVAIGNSKGIRLPRAILQQCGLEDDIELEVKGDQLVVRAGSDSHSRSHPLGE